MKCLCQTSSFTFLQKTRQQHITTTVFSVQGWTHVCERWPVPGSPPCCPTWRTPGSYRPSCPAGRGWWRWWQGLAQAGTSHRPLGAGRHITRFSQYAGQSLEYWDVAWCQASSNLGDHGVPLALLHICFNGWCYWILNQQLAVNSEHKLNAL